MRPMLPTVTREDLELLTRFDATSIPEAEWSHACHLRIAYLALCVQPYPQAVRRLRDGIRRLDRAHGIPEGDERGYHETLALAWLRLVAAALDSGTPGADSRSFLAMHPELGREDRVLEHYSPDRVRTARARREFVLPDRAPLPALRPPTVGNRSDPRKDRVADLDDPAPRAHGHILKASRRTP